MFGQINSSLLTSSLSAHSYPHRSRHPSHKWRRNAETGRSSWGPRAAQRAIPMASLRSVTHRLADAPRVSRTRWWTKSWSWIDPLTVTEPGGERFHHRYRGGLAHRVCGKCERHKAEGQQLYCAVALLMHSSRAKTYPSISFWLFTLLGYSVKLQACTVWNMGGGKKAKFWSYNGANFLWLLICFTQK